MVFYFVVAGKRAWGSSIAEDICDMEGENYGMTELEEWVEFFEEKGCEECAGLSDFRISLKDAYTRWLFAFGLVLRRRRAMLRKGVGFGREVQEASGVSDAVDGGDS